jgi:uncharacterized protein (TIGR03000 family)
MVRALVPLALACVALAPGSARAQPGPFVGVGVGVGNWGYPYGPRVAPPWGYPGLAGGPFVGYPFAPGFFGFSGRAGSSWSNGLSLYGPPVPVYGPIPGVLGNDDLVRQWRSTLPVGLQGYGWVGVYAASPRLRPNTVSARPLSESFGSAPTVARPLAPAAAPGGCLVLSVKVPQPAAEVFVDGAKTAQTGTDRTFESPPLDAGKRYAYTVTARWIENGRTVERSQQVEGEPGEVVRVDFGAATAAARR